MEFPDFNNPNQKQTNQPIKTPILDFDSLSQPVNGFLDGSFDFDINDVLYNKNKVIENGEPKRPSGTDLLRDISLSNEGKIDLLRPIGRYGNEESKRFQNPFLKYDPEIDNEDVYARFDPFTVGDAFGKAWDIMWSSNSFSQVGAGMKEVVNGNLGGFYDNAYNKEIAESLEKLDQLNQQFRTVEDRESFDLSSSLLGLIPALGYVGQFAKDAAVGHLAVTVGGAIAGDGIASIPAAIGGNI
ncbi:MAG: hypothetical protein ACRDBG_16005, partial [Waterburya sp.]